MSRKCLSVCPSSQNMRPSSDLFGCCQLARFHRVQKGATTTINLSTLGVATSTKRGVRTGRSLTLPLPGSNPTPVVRSSSHLEGVALFFVAFRGAADCSDFGEVCKFLQRLGYHRWRSRLIAFLFSFQDFEELLDRLLATCVSVSIDGLDCVRPLIWFCDAVESRHEPNIERDEYGNRVPRPGSRWVRQLFNLLVHCQVLHAQINSIQFGLVSAWQRTEACAKIDHKGY